MIADRVADVNRDFLPTSSYVVLGLLSFGQRLTGYELRRWALGSTRFFWSAPAMSQIYRDLDQLRSAGLVDARDESGGSERARTTYGLTAAGDREVRRWVAEAPYEPPTLRLPAAFRLFLGHLADADRLTELLTAHRDWLDGVLADLADVRADLAGDERFAHADLVAEWGQRLFGADRDATNQIVETVGTTGPREDPP